MRTETWWRDATVAMFLVVQDVAISWKIQTSSTSRSGAFENTEFGFTLRSRTSSLGEHLLGGMGPTYCDTAPDYRARSNSRAEYT